jgi:hypothetical protein
MTIDQIAQSVAAMTPGPWVSWTYPTGMADIETESGVMVSGYVNSDVVSLGGADAAGIVALRNHADALIECAALLKEARESVWYEVHNRPYSHQPANERLARIDAALARLEEIK